MLGGYIPAPQHAVRKIQGMILSGELKPGERLPGQRELSQRLRISRASLREALSVLETLGLLSIEPGRGAFITDPEERGEELPHWRFAQSYSEEEVYHARMGIEPYLARLAARAVDEARLRALQSAVAGMREAIASGDLVATASQDSAFHRLICEASDNRMLIAIYGSLGSILEESQRRPFVRQDRIDETLQEHAAILEAISARDPERAATAMADHLRRAAARIGLRL